MARSSELVCRLLALRLLRGPGTCIRHQNPSSQEVPQPGHPTPHPLPPQGFGKHREGAGSEADTCALRPSLCLFSPAPCWARKFLSPSLSFPTCKVGVLIEPTSGLSWGEMQSMIPEHSSTGGAVPCVPLTQEEEPRRNLAGCLGLPPWCRLPSPLQKLQNRNKRCHPRLRSHPPTCPFVHPF